MLLGSPHLPWGEGGRLLREARGAWAATLAAECLAALGRAHVEGALATAVRRGPLSKTWYWEEGE